MKATNDKTRDSGEMSIPVRAGIALFMFGLAVMLTLGLFFPETPLSPENMGKASGGSRGGYAPEMMWAVIPFLYWASYHAAKIVIREIKAKRRSG